MNVNIAELYEDYISRQRIDIKVLQLDACEALQLANYLEHMVKDLGYRAVEIELDCPEDSNGAYLNYSIYE